MELMGIIASLKELTDDTFVYTPFPYITGKGWG